MTLPQPAPPRKPRRLGLWAPFIALGIGVAVWSGYWLMLRNQTLRRLDAVAAAPDHRLSWTARKVYGYPFRLDVEFSGVSWRDPSGWSLSAPSLKTEAFAFAPDHWVAFAPAGATWTRPVGGPILIGAKVLRASLSDASAHPPRFSLEAFGLTFAPGPGAAPFALTAATEAHVHTRAGPNDEGAFYLELDGAKARLTGLIGRIAAGKPVSLIADAFYSHAGALAGPDWKGAVGAWSAAGGALEVRHLKLQAGDALFEAHAGSLTVDDDGRLRGSLSATLRQAQRTLSVMAQQGTIAPEQAGTAESVVGARSGAPLAAVTLDFEAGRTTLGPAALGPAPKVY